MDIFVGDVNAGLFVYAGTGGRAFAGPMALSAGKVTPGAVAVADLDRDGLLDLVVGNDQRPGAILFNQGTGTQLRFVTASWNHGAGSVYAIVIGDLDGDGWPDIAAARSDARNALCFSGASARKRRQSRTTALHLISTRAAGRGNAVTASVARAGGAVRKNSMYAPFMAA